MVRVSRRKKNLTRHHAWWTRALRKTLSAGSEVSRRTSKVQASLLDTFPPQQYAGLFRFKSADDIQHLMDELHFPVDEY